MRLLNLCSGTGSVSAPFRENGWEVVEVDWDNRFDPTHVVDITKWDYTIYDHFDVIWCSPDCTQYSRARTRAKTPRNLEKADELVRACLRIVEHFSPAVWFLENPDSGLLKTRDVVRDLAYVKVDYCMYARPYRKRTRLWTNCCWTPKLCDRSHLVNNRHECSAQRGSSCKYNSTFTRDQLHRLPTALCQEIYKVCTAQCQAIDTEDGSSSLTSDVAVVLNPKRQQEQQLQSLSHAFAT